MNNNRTKYQEEKEAFLINHGLTKKVFYEGDDGDSWDFPNKEYFKRGLNPETQTYTWYKEIPIEISDEEYEVFLADESAVNIYKNEKNINDDLPEETNHTESNNNVATAITVIAVSIFIVSFILGIVYGNTFKLVILDRDRKSEESFNFVAMIITWCIGIVSGTLMLGFAEIIKLLQKIHNKQK